MRNWRNVILLGMLVCAGIPAEETRPYGGAPIELPGTILAVNFDEGGEGTAYHHAPTEGGGNDNPIRWQETIAIQNARDVEGGYYVGNSQQGDWLNYTVDVKAPGTYDLEVSVASAAKTAGAFHFEVNGKAVTPVLDVLLTGDQNLYETVVSQITLNPGRQVLRLCMDRIGSLKSVGNFKWIRISQAGSIVKPIAKGTVQQLIGVVLNASSLVQANRAQEAVDALNIAIADAGQNAELISKIRIARGAAYAKLKQFDWAIADYDAGRSAISDIRRKTQVEGWIINAFSDAGRVQEAVGYVEKVVQEAGNDMTRIAAVLGQEAALFMKLRRYEEAERVYSRIRRECASIERAVADADTGIAECAARLENFDAAIAKYREIANNRVDMSPSEYYRGIYDRLGEMLLRSKKYADARAAYDQASKASKDPWYHGYCLRLIAESHTVENDVPGAVTAYAKLLTDFPLEFKHCQDSLKVLFTIHSNRKDSKKAKAIACRYYCCANSSAAMEDAVQFITRTLRAEGSSIDAVNAFLKFQLDGSNGTDKKPGTADDLVNPLAAFFISSIGPDKDERLLLDKALDKYPNNARARGYLLLYFGLPREALREFKRGLQSSALDDRSFRTAVDDCIVGLKAVNGHIFDGPAFVDYLMYGSKGKDGKSNLIDPLKDY